MTDSAFLADAPILLDAPDGRLLEVRLAGPEDGFPLVHHHGTPQAAWPFPALEEAAADLGLRTITYSRPGYGASTARARAATIAADVDDVVTVLDHLGLDRFVTVGWSGGGPRAIACAALLPGRCLAAASGVGVAPYVGFEEQFLEGMGEENVEEFGAAIEGESSLRPLLESWRPGFAHMTGATVVEGMGDLLPDVDRAWLTGERADGMAATFRHALSRGIEGWLHDDLAFLRPWGFDLAEITVPVTLWQGRQDRMVPFAHAERLAAEVAGARPHFTEADGHLSLFDRLPEILDELRELADL